MKAQVERLKLRKGGRLDLRVAVNDAPAGAELSLVLQHRSSAARHMLATAKAQGAGTADMRASSDLAALLTLQVYWDLYVEYESPDGPVQEHCKCARALQVRLVAGCVQAELPGGLICIPYMVRNRCLAFIVREASKFDGRKTRAKELAALVVAKLGTPYFRRKRIWIVNEKFCMRAQDNGFHFFCYCMEELPAQERAHIFYVIDSSSPDYAHVAAYGSNVLEFMSFKHLCYALHAQLIIASEASFHLYHWRSKPSLVKRKIKIRPTFFLQHGVTAMKRVDDLFGREGLYPMDWFLTTSAREQALVVEHFGYTEQTAPILGFARWDALEDCSQADAPELLVAPTWRPWLDGVEDEEFLDSVYCRAYRGLLSSARLAELLERSNATLLFYLHPRLSSYIKLFESENPRIKIVKEGDVALNKLIMSCSALVTDYSSLAWDVAYLDKPVVFYHFDADVYAERVGSYIDFRVDLPGVAAAGTEELVDELEALVQRGFAVAPETASKVESWFAYRDVDNCRRIYDFVRGIAKGRP